MLEDKKNPPGHGHSCLNLDYCVSLFLACSTLCTHQLLYYIEQPEGPSIHHVQLGLSEGKRVCQDLCRTGFLPHDHCTVSMDPSLDEADLVPTWPNDIFNKARHSNASIYTVGDAALRPGCTSATRKHLYEPSQATTKYMM